MHMNKRRLLSISTLMVALAAVATLAAAPTQPADGGTRTAEADDDHGETAISGDPLARASAAALAHTGGGRVTGTEVGDEESYYEVEVTLDNGRQVDVQLDRTFHVVGDENEDRADRD
jgi:uncharacterized membrane protein YkoI